MERSSSRRPRRMTHNAKSELSVVECNWLGETLETAVEYLRCSHYHSNLIRPEDIDTGILFGLKVVFASFCGSNRCFFGQTKWCLSSELR